MKKLTKRQKATYKAILNYMYRAGIPPTFDYLREILGYKSVNSVTGHLQALERKNYIIMVKGISRSIVIINTGICPYCRRGD